MTPQPYPLVAVDRNYRRWLVLGWLVVGGQEITSTSPAMVPLVVAWTSDLLPATTTMVYPDGTQSRVYHGPSPAAPTVLALEDVREWLLPAPDEVTRVELREG